MSKREKNTPLPIRLDCKIHGNDVIHLLSEEAGSAWLCRYCARENMFVLPITRELRKIYHHYFYGDVGNSIPNTSEKTESRH